MPRRPEPPPRPDGCRRDGPGGRAGGRMGRWRTGGGPVRGHRCASGAGQGTSACSGESGAVVPMEEHDGTRFLGRGGVVVASASVGHGVGRPAVGSEGGPWLGRSARGGPGGGPAVGREEGPRWAGGGPLRRIWCLRVGRGARGHQIFWARGSAARRPAQDDADHAHRWLPEGNDPDAFDAGEATAAMQLWARGEHLPWHGLPEPLAELVKGLRGPGWTQANAWLAALGSRRAVELDDDDVRRAARPWLAVLQAIGPGSKLTAAGYLPPAMVAEIAQSAGVTQWWIGKANRSGPQCPGDEPDNPQPAVAPDSHGRAELNRSPEPEETTGCGVRPRRARASSDLRHGLERRCPRCPGGVI